MATPNNFKDTVMNSYIPPALSRIKLLSFALIMFGLLACQSEPSAQVAEVEVDPDKYTVLQKPINVSTGDKIEVAELFWYGCGHCFALEPHVEKWKENMPENAEFVKVPAIFSKRWEFHGKAYYTMEALGVLDKANEAFFHQIHIQNKPINTMPQLVDFLAKFDLGEEEVSKAFNSFAVDTKFRNANKITRMSTASGVPAVLVDGKYHTSVSLAGGATELFEVVNQLVAKAAAER